MSDQTFLTNALDAIADQTHKIARTARFVLTESPIDSIDLEPTIAYQFVEAYVAAQSDRKETKATGETYTGVKPESLLALAGRVMDKACWNARKQLISQQMSEDTDRKNGIDYSQDTAEVTGVYTETKYIPDIITEDYRTMVAVYGWLVEKMLYLENVADVIPMFSIKEKTKDEDGNDIWVTISECYNWEDALETMNEKAQELSGFNEHYDREMNAIEGMEDMKSRLSA
jgi:hypothetical protein